MIIQTVGRIQHKTRAVSVQKKNDGKLLYLHNFLFIQSVHLLKFHYSQAQSISANQTRPEGMRPHFKFMTEAMKGLKSPPWLELFSTEGHRRGFISLSEMKSGPGRQSSKRQRPFKGHMFFPVKDFRPAVDFVRPDY